MHPPCFCGLLSTNANDIEVIPFVLPVNYQLAKELLADEFDTNTVETPHSRLDLWM